MPARLKYLPVIIAFLAIFSFSLTEILAVNDVLINEFSPASSPEWIEIYNPSNETCPLKEVALFLDDNPETTQKLSFCDGETIAPHSFRLIVRPEKSFWLANSGDSLLLKRGDDVIDIIAYGSDGVLKSPTATQSATRFPDGGPEWIITNSPTQQGEAVSFDCPTPTSPSVETLPTSTPTPEGSSSLKSSPTPSPRAVELAATLAGEVLGQESTPGGIYLLEPSPSPEASGEAIANNKTLPVIFLGAGLVFFVAAGLSLWYTKWRCPG